MWLRNLGKAAFAAKNLYTIVFFGVLTWHVLKYQVKGHHPASHKEKFK